MSSCWMRLVDAAYRDVFSSRHLEAHEVLKDDADMAVKIFEGVLPQVDAVEQYLSLRWDRRGA